MAGGKGTRLKSGGVFTGPKPTLHTDCFDVVKNHLLGLSGLGADEIYYVLNDRHEEVHEYVESVVSELDDKFNSKVTFILDAQSNGKDTIGQASKDAFIQASMAGYDTVYYTLSDHLIPYKHLIRKTIITKEDLFEAPVLDLKGPRHSYCNPLDYLKLGGEMPQKDTIRLGLSFLNIIGSYQLYEKARCQGITDWNEYVKLVPSKNVGYVPRFNINDTKTLKYADCVIKGLGKKASSYFFL